MANISLAERACKNDCGKFRFPSSYFFILYPMLNANDLIQVKCSCLALFPYASFKVFATHLI